MFVLSSLESAFSFFEFGAIASQRSKSSTSGCETQETSGNYETNRKIKTTTEKIKIKSGPKKNPSDLSPTWHHSIAVFLMRHFFSSSLCFLPFPYSQKTLSHVVMLWLPISNHPFGFSLSYIPSRRFSQETHTIVLINFLKYGSHDASTFLGSQNLQ
jgi:hypothetical protein